MKNNYSPEQIEAINTDGGALISAGAGSGKTAVLIEHLIHWISGINGFASKQEELIIKQLKQLVVVTFTVKASKEMRMRLNEKVQALEQSDDGEQWKIVGKNLNKIFIGTIDSFCSSLIQANKESMGVDIPIAIASAQEWQFKMQELFWKWHGQESNSQLKMISTIWSKKIIAWLIKVFSSPQDRMTWVAAKNGINKDKFLANNQDDFAKILEHFEWESIRQETIEIYNGLDKKTYGDKKWFIYLSAMVNKMQLSHDFAALEQLILFNRDQKGIIGPRTDDLTHVNGSIKKLKKFFTNINEIYDDWQKCQQNNGIEDWYNFILIAEKLIAYVEKNYGLIKGFCFADLSYYALKFLKNKYVPGDLKPYVVIDELQDTSKLQLEIILEYVKNDFSRLYGVGDIKQAIYSFRGGESHVFFEFQNLVKTRVDLLDNYRSVPAIVDFNNNIFSHLFDSTRSIPQVPKTSMKVATDIAPVECLRWEIPENDKIEEWQQEILEYHALILKIKKIMALDPTGSISVLFRTNNQIKKFSSLLSQEKITFNVQWKIKFEEDPLFQIFYYLLLISEGRKNAKDTTHLEKILTFHYHSIDGGQKISLTHFLEEECMFDVYTNYIRWMNEHGLVLAFQAPFLEILKERASITESTTKDYLLWLEEIKEEETLVHWTLPESNGENNSLVLQTIHASKGLQYDHILMSRISSRMKGNYSDNLILESENFYAFREITFLKQPWKNPSWYKIQLDKKFLQNEESVRLFYVACTRPRKSLTMSFASTAGADSWADLVCRSEQKYAQQTFMPLDDRAKEILELELRLLPIYEAKIYSNWKKKFIKEEQTNILKLLPSLSVTTLMIYERCPMKYYFSNVLGLDPDDTKKSQNISVSSSERGSKVHLELQNYFLNKSKFEQTEQQLDGAVKTMFGKFGKAWLEQVSEAEHVGIEEQFRFFWKGSIILGTPDLYLVKNECCEVWDFKTGMLDQEDIDTYFWQLIWYAYALKQHGYAKKEIKLKIIALDDQVIHEKIIASAELENLLEQWWQRFFYYHTKNLNHCEKCSYQLFCNKKVQ